MAPCSLTADVSVTLMPVSLTPTATISAATIPTPSLLSPPLLIFPIIPIHTTTNFLPPFLLPLLPTHHHHAICIHTQTHLHLPLILHIKLPHTLPLPLLPSFHPSPHAHLPTSHEPACNFSCRIVPSPVCH
ncbi:unnamed protein product [Closterium sp. NIES-54]